VLKAQNLTGTLPPELVNLPYLEEIDLTLNYLSGTIPEQWGSFTRLLNMKKIKIKRKNTFLYCWKYSVLKAQNLTGTLPPELVNLPYLEEIELTLNYLSGTIPQQWGSFTRLLNIFLTSNNFTGEVPETFAGLMTMNDLRIGDNNFSGKIPDFIQNWTNLEKLVIQASGLNGPIPRHIAFLENLSDLILRSCNITGQLPEYLWKMNKLTTLDLSFNKLTGEIPSSYNLLTQVSNWKLAKWTSALLDAKQRQQHVSFSSKLM
ncbi:putative leucine-rich repeat receptor-like serine/threonine-protein kinase, partial [Quercus suber]